MKWTKLRIVLIVLQFICFFALPILFVWLQYSDNEKLGSGYKMAITGLVLVAFICVLVKRVFLNDYLNRLSTRLATMETQALTTTHEKAIKTLKSSYKLNSLINLIISMVLPICIFVVALLTCKALEEQTIKLYGVLSMITLCFCVGYILKFVEILTIKLKHEV